MQFGRRPPLIIANCISAATFAVATWVAQMPIGKTKTEDLSDFQRVASEIPSLRQQHFRGLRLRHDDMDLQRRILIR